MAELVNQLFSVGVLKMLDFSLKSPSDLSSGLTNRIPESLLAGGSHRMPLHPAKIA